VSANGNSLGLFIGELSHAYRMGKVHGASLITRQGWVSNAYKQLDYSILRLIDAGIPLLINMRIQALPQELLLFIGRGARDYAAQDHYRTEYRHQVFYNVASIGNHIELLPIEEAPVLASGMFHSTKCGAGVQ
jgi:hypothetical protein